MSDEYNCIIAPEPYQTVLYYGKEFNTNKACFLPCPLQFRRRGFNRSSHRAVFGYYGGTNDKLYSRKGNIIMIC